jgi:hypothetical protein
MLIALVDHVIQILSRRRLHRLETEVVDDQQIGSGIAGEAFVVRAIGTPGMEVAQHFVGIGEDDVEATPTGFMGQGLGEMTLSATIDMPPSRKTLVAQSSADIFS